jgi:hypothetical protein
MTEEDTFLRLKKVSFQEMKILYLKWFSENIDFVTPTSDFYKKRNSFFEEHGWTWHDYLYRL